MFLMCSLFFVICSLLVPYFVPYRQKHYFSLFVGIPLLFVILRFLCVCVSLTALATRALSELKEGKHRKHINRQAAILTRPQGREDMPHCSLGFLTNSFVYVRFGWADYFENKRHW